MSSRLEYSVEFLYKSGGSEEMVATPRCARNIQTSARYEAVGRTLCKAAVWSQQIQALAKYMFSQMSPLKYFFAILKAMVLSSLAFDAVKPVQSTSDSETDFLPLALQFWPCEHWRVWSAANTSGAACATPNPSKC